MTVTIKSETPLRIHSYVDKYNRTYYIAFFDGKFRFVHMSDSKFGTLKHRRNKKGKPYLEYDGEFVLSRNGNIFVE